MLNVSELLQDPDFAQPFSIQRSSGAFVSGGFETITTTVAAWGVILPASDQDLAQVPAGDRVTGTISIHTAQQLFQTHGGSQPGLSDVIAWNGETYRILQLFPYQDFGYTKALAARMSGQ